MGDITKLDRKMMAQAYSYAKGSEFKRARMSCVAGYKHQTSPVCYGVNSHKTHPLQEKYNVLRDDFEDDGVGVMPKIHAEMDCVASLQTIIKKTGISPNDITLYIARACNQRKYGMARPCKACMKAIHDLGIRKIVYTTNVGIAKEIIDRV